MNHPWIVCISLIEMDTDRPLITLGTWVMLEAGGVPLMAGNNVITNPFLRQSARSTLRKEAHIAAVLMNEICFQIQFFTMNNCVTSTVQLWICTWSAFSFEKMNYSRCFADVRGLRGAIVTSSAASKRHSTGAWFVKFMVTMSASFR